MLRTGSGGPLRETSVCLVSDVISSAPPHHKVNDAEHLSHMLHIYLNVA